VNPERYEQQAAKYAGREATMQQRIPTLDCLWNDVLHLSPVHPVKIAELAGACGVGWGVAEWYELDPVAMGFNSANTSFFRYRKVDDVTMADDEFEPFDLAKLSELTELPQSTRDYYAAAGRSGGRYFIFVGIPHILHRGALDVSSIPVVRV
jgi:hypothetical protein